MMQRQMTLSMALDAGFERHRRPTRRDAFLAEMDKMVPWDAPVRLHRTVLSQAPGGRQPIGLERMLRIHLLQQWYALSDPAMEEALYDSQAMRRFVGIDRGTEGAPDETTICKFRHLLERHDLASGLFAAISEHLKQHGMRLSTGTIVDATIISAPSSTKSKEKRRDPAMHPTRKGNQWFFGLKALASAGGAFTSPSSAARSGQSRTRRSQN